MRDDRARWTPPGAAEQTQTLTGATLVPVSGLRQTMISSPTVLQDPATGWPEIIRGTPYRVAMRRDRVLEVGGDRQTIGWDSVLNRAVSDANGLYAVFDLSGPEALALLQRGTELTLGTPSRSVVRRLFGLEVLVYRMAETSFRLHVGAAYAEALVNHLRTADAHRNP